MVARLMDEPPVRLCCMQRHFGIVCPDGQVMCPICFERHPMHEGWRDPTGNLWDLCVACGEAEA